MDVVAAVFATAVVAGLVAGGAVVLFAIIRDAFF